MDKYYGLGLIIIVLIAIQFWNAYKDKTKTIVLGKEMADATDKERSRIEAGNFLPSPLPSYDYSKWSEEQSLRDPIENKLDGVITQLCTIFKTYDENKRADTRKSLSQDNIYTLLEFSKRVTIFGIRKTEQAFIDNGFTVLAMIDLHRCDYRDILVTLGFLNFGLHKLTLDQQSIVQETVRLSDHDTKELIEEFFNRNEKNRRIEEMAGYTAIETSKGVSFIGTGYKKYSPKYNLASILFEISNFIYRDKYQKGRISIREDVPLVWLGAENNKVVTKTLMTTTGTAYISSDLRQEFSPQSDMQLLLVYLSELNDDKNQKLILEHLNDTPPTTFKRIAFFQDNILCVIVQRATMVGLDDFESQESLKKFEKPFRDLIQQNK